jgi:4'-phosphopantetheinyl transferase
MTMLAPPRIATENLPVLGPHDLHVWHMDIDRPGSIAQAVGRDACLSDAEKLRLSALADPGARALARLARGGLRHLLGQYLGIAPAEVAFSTTTNGKPVLAGRGRAAGLEFNLSHSGRRVAIAVSSGAAVGIDIEKIRPSPRLIRVAHRFFATEEAASLAALSQEDRQTAFFQIWTLKEAFIKTTGRGLSQRLNSFAVAADPPARLLRCDDTPGAANWQYDCRQITASYICSVICADPLARPIHFNG